MFDPQPIRIETAEIKNLIDGIKSKLLKGKFIIIGTTLVFFLAAIAWRLLSTPSYIAKCTFVLEEKGGGGTGLSGLASQFGLDLGALGGGSGNFFSGENINDIIASSTIMEKVLLSKADDAVSLADHYLDASGMRNAMGWNGQLTSLSFSKTASSLDEQRLRDTVLMVIQKKIKEKNLIIDKTNKKGTIFGVEVKSSDPHFAKLLTERLVSVTSEMYIDIKTRNLTSNITKLERRADSLRQLFGDKSRQTYSLQILDANEAFKSNLSMAEISQRDKTVIFELYAEVMKNLEISRMMLINQTPVIQLLDRPREPLVDTRFSILIVSVIGLAIGFLLGSLFSLLKY
jgi:hypothetical protein